MPILQTKLLLSTRSVLAILVIFSFNSCTPQSNALNTAIETKLAIADSLYFLGSDSARIVLQSARKDLDITNPLISTYYCQMADKFIGDVTKNNLYADSALAFFTNDVRIKKYPDLYYNALLSKGDACLRSGKYITALNYYYQGKEMVSKIECYNGELSAKLAQIYYGQQNFSLAGKYWAQSYSRIGLCDTRSSAQKIFFLRQGALNNAGFSYEQAGMLDSANYYYLKDESLLKKAESENLVNHNLNTPRAVLYDNIGGLNLLKGNLVAAQTYLLKSLQLYNNYTGDGSMIPPYLKLADLYIKTNDYPKAIDALTKSKALLNKYGKNNAELALKWNKLYAEYLFTQHDATGAYQYQNDYIRVKDSINNKLGDLYRLDVERELNVLQQKESITDYKQKTQIKKIYLIATGIILPLFIVIIFLIYRNLKRFKKNTGEVRQENGHLQVTLTELERVNTNYLRVMRVMAHDLRNPISGMAGLAAMLQEGDEFSEDSKNMLRLIETTGIHSLEMINELLKTGLADENEKIEIQSIDLAALMYDSVELLQFKANEKKQQIIFESDKAEIFANVNHEKMWRVVNNLIVNAIKFSHTGSVIHVGIKHNDKFVLISVADNGIGIPPENKESVFEMFTPAKKPGTDGEQPFGLGLSISKRIIDMHNGRIWFDNNIGGGTIFYIELPYTE